MTANKILDPVFDWGDTVIIKQIAPKHYKPGARGSICGMRTIDSLETAKQFNQMIGSVLFLVEFNDGETLEVPNFFLSISTES